MSAPPAAKISVRDLTLAYGSYVVMKDLEFDIRDRDIFIIMGGSGCGKSTLLRHLVGLQAPTAGHIRHRGIDLQTASAAELAEVRRHFGVMFQAGALWSSMTVGENVMLPMEMFTDATAPERAARARHQARGDLVHRGSGHRGAGAEAPAGRRARRGEGRRTRAAVRAAGLIHQSPAPPIAGPHSRK